MTEKEQLDGLDKYQRRYLKRFSCFWCGRSLSNSGCSSIVEVTCDEMSRVKRRANCLTKYKPRLNRRKLGVCHAN